MATRRTARNQTAALGHVGRHRPPRAKPPPSTPPGTTKKAQAEQPRAMAIDNARAPKTARPARPGHRQPCAQPRRLEIGLNVGQLAERTGISKGMLSKIENAQTSPSLSTLERLAAALDMPVTSLFRGLAEERDAVFVKAGSGPEIVRKGTRAGHTYELLGSLRGPVQDGSSRCSSRWTTRPRSSPSSSTRGSRSSTCSTGSWSTATAGSATRWSAATPCSSRATSPTGPTMLVKLPIRFLSITIYNGERG